MDHRRKLEIAMMMLLSSWDDEKREEICKIYLREYYTEIASDEEQYELIEDMNVDGQVSHHRWLRSIGAWL